MAQKTYLLDPVEFIDFMLYGIASNYVQSPFFVFHLNRSFGTQFVRSEDLEVIIREEPLYFPRFEWEDSQTNVYYTLLKNVGYNLFVEREQNNLTSLFDISPPLISQLKDYSYILKINADSEEIEIPFLENSFIQKIVELNTEKIKNIDRLIF